MEISEFNQDGVTVVEPRGRVDTTTSRSLNERLLALDSNSNIIVDLSSVDYISSAGFRALLVAAKRASDSDSRFALCGLTAEVRRLFEIGAFLDLFQIYSVRAEGVSALNVQS